MVFFFFGRMIGTVTHASHVRCCRHACLTLSAVAAACQPASPPAAASWVCIHVCMYLLRVPLPPMGMVPKRLKGTEKVTTLGVTSRMTMTSAGLVGISLDDMLLRSWFGDDFENGFSETAPVSTPSPIAAAGNRRKAVPRGPGRRRWWGDDDGLLKLVVE